MLYLHWLQSCKITDVSKTHSSNQINEVFSLFLVLEEGPEFQVAITEKLECMLEVLSQQFSAQITESHGLSEEWNTEAERIFLKIDEDRKGYLDGEGLQFFTLALIMQESRNLEPLMLRKKTHEMLKEMKHTNGIVSMRGFKNYLIHKMWNTLQHITSLAGKLQRVLDIWRSIRSKILRREIDDLAQCTFLGGNKQELPSIWNQAIMLSLNTSVKSKSNYKLDWEKLYKFLRFSGWALGCTPSASTKGVCYIEGTYLKDIPEFSIYLMTNYLELEGQFHTSVSLANINQQTLCRVSGDSRFQVIHRSLVNYDKIINSVLYEIISAGTSRPGTPKLTRNASVSLVRTLNSTARTVASLKSVRTVSNLLKIHSKPKKPITVSVRLITPSSSARVISRHSSTRSARSKSPMLGRLESYDKVMNRLHK